MSNTVFIRIHKDNSADIYQSEDGSMVLSRTGSSLDQIAESCRGKKLVVFIPGSDVHLATHMIPARNRQKILQAIPYAMEEDLIGDIHQFHFAIPARLPTGGIPVCAISRERLDALLALLDDHHLHAQVITVDTLTLPCNQGHWNVLVEDHETTIQTGQYAGFTLDTASLDEFMDIAIQEAGEQAPLQLNIFDARSTEQAPVLENLDSSTIEITRNPLSSSLLELQANYYQDGSAINLLQGAYTARKIANQTLKKWYPAITLLAIILFIQSASAIIHYIDLYQTAETLDTQIKQIFEQALPDVKRMVDPKSQLQQRLSSLQSNQPSGDSGFLQIMAKFAQAMQTNPSINLKGLNFRDGQLDIDLNINDLQALEKLKQAVTQAGITVDIRSAAVQGKVVSARLRVQEKGQ